MNAVLVDTDVFSFLFKGHSLGALYDADLHGKIAALSFMTVAELDRWAIQSNWSDTRKSWLGLFMEPFTMIAYHLMYEVGRSYGFGPGKRVPH